MQLKGYIMQAGEQTNTDTHTRYTGNRGMMHFMNMCLQCLLPLLLLFLPPHSGHWHTGWLPQHLQPLPRVVASTCQLDSVVVSPPLADADADLL